jgi:beta-glucosidase
MGVNACQKDEIYLKGFEITVKESQPWTLCLPIILLMEHTQRKDLLTTTLLTNGIQRIIMTDWFEATTDLSY